MCRTNSSLSKRTDVGDFEQTMEGSVTFNRIHLTSHIEAAQPHGPHVRQRAPTAHAYMDHFPFPAGTGQRCCSKCGTQV